METMADWAPECMQPVGLTMETTVLIQPLLQAMEPNLQQITGCINQWESSLV